MFTYQHQEEAQYPELQCTRILGRFTKIQYYWCNLKLAQRKGLHFYQTRSNAITLFNTLFAICVENVVYMKIGEDFYCKVHQYPRLPRVVRTPNLHHGRQDLSNPKERASADHQSKRNEEYDETRSAKFEETRSGNMVFRIHGPPHSTVQKEDYARREMVKKLIHQFDTHPNRDSSMEYFELREISSKIQCPDCSFFWDVGIVHCTCGKCLQPSERNRRLHKDIIRRLVNSRFRPTEQDTDQLCRSTTKHTTCSRKPRRNSAALFSKGGTKTISTEVLCQKMGGVKKL